MKCANCEAEIKKEDKFCSNCGHAIKENTIIGSPPPDIKPTAKSKYSVMGAFSYFGVLFLISIPVIGLFITIIWALGGTKKVNKRNFARGIVIYVVFNRLISSLLLYGWCNYLNIKSPEIIETIEKTFNAQEIDNFFENFIYEHNGDEILMDYIKVSGEEN